MTSDEMALVALIGSCDAPLARWRAADVLFGDTSRGNAMLLLQKAARRLVELGFVVPEGGYKPLSLSARGRLLLAVVLFREPGLLAAYYDET